MIRAFQNLPADSYYLFLLKLVFYHPTRFYPSSAFVNIRFGNRRRLVSRERERGRNLLFANSSTRTRYPSFEGEIVRIDQRPTRILRASLSSPRLGEKPGSFPCFIPVNGESSGARGGRGEERKGKDERGFCRRNGRCRGEARGFANSTRSRSIIVAKSAVIMLDILIRGNSKEKLDPSFCVFFSVLPFRHPPPLLGSPYPSTHTHTHTLHGFRLPFTFISRLR